MEKSEDPGQTAPLEKVWSGFALFALTFGLLLYMSWPWIKPGSSGSQRRNSTETCPFT